MTVSKTTKKRQPTKRKEFSLNSFREQEPLFGNDKVEEKELRWIHLGKSFEDATGLPGYPLGYVTLLRGHSDTGKSTGIYAGIKAAIDEGVLPIIIDTESNISKDRLALMGVNLDDDTLYLRPSHVLQIAKRYGKQKIGTRDEASIEDMADTVNYFMDLQRNGDMNVDICFFIDSIGILNCNRAIASADKGGEGNNQWNAGAYEAAFKNILNVRIPDTRKKLNLDDGSECPYTCSLVAVQKIWIDGQNNNSINHKGGKAFWYASRLIYHFGGIIAASVRKLDAQTKGKNVEFGIKTKLAVAKNQVAGKFGGIAYKGEIASVPHGFIDATPEAKKQYKEDNIDYFATVLKEPTLTTSELSLVEIDTETGEIEEEITQEALDRVN